jgi:hypothetical protein
LFFLLFLSRDPFGDGSIPSGSSQKIPALVLGALSPIGAIMFNQENPQNPDETSVSVAGPSGF